jgi:hypothetical protein
MINKFDGSFSEIIDQLPDNFVVLDVGGAASPTKRANYVIDYATFNEIAWDLAKGGGDVMFSKDSYIQHDICSREKWPFEDKQFDYSICSHVLEDIRDPIWVCSEIIRVSKAGYIEIPARIYEQKFGIEAKKFTGASHHRWLIDLFENKLRFTFKNFYVHSKVLNKNRRLPKKSDLFLRLKWSNNFEYYENYLKSGKEEFEYILDRQISENKKWEIFRKIGPNNFFISYLKYLKNTNKMFNRIFIFFKKYLKI